jgi:hypothetical protein
MSETMVVSGLAVASPNYPPAGVIKKAYDAVDLFQKVATGAVEHQTTVQENDLLLIDQDAQRLNELSSKGLTPSNNLEASELRSRLLKRARQNENSYAFLGKALADPNTLYVLAKYSLADKVSEVVGKQSAELLGVGESTKLAFLGDGRIRKQLSRTQWRNLKEVAKFGQSLNDELTNALIKKLAEQVTLEQLGRELDSRVDEIMKRVRPSSAGVGTGRDFGDLRFNAISQPDIFMPVLLPPALESANSRQHQQQLEVESPRLELAREPLVIRTYQDPLFQTAFVQSQVIKRVYAPSDYSVTFSQPVGGISIDFDVSQYANPNFDGR